MIDASIPPLLFTNQAAAVGGDRALRRAFERGEYVRVRTGAYARAAHWRGLRADERYRAFVHAAGATLEKSTQFSHDSAVALWHLPAIGPWPSGVHTLAAPAAGGVSSRGIVRHTIGLDAQAVPINLLNASSLHRTVLDFARSTTFMRAVCAADAALAHPDDGSFRAINGHGPADPAQLVAMLDALGSARGAAKARRVMGFANGLSGSAGESVSRVQFHLIGFPPPELQVPFFDAEGFIGYVDFYWPEIDLIGEFDGDVKYLGETYRRGMLPEEVVLAEKRREDRLRRVARAFTRWDWPVALDQRRLVDRLQPHGLVPLR